MDDTFVERHGHRSISNNLKTVWKNRRGEKVSFSRGARELKRRNDTQFFFFFFFFLHCPRAERSSKRVSIYVEIRVNTGNSRASNHYPGSALSNESAIRVARSLQSAASFSRKFVPPECSRKILRVLCTDGSGELCDRTRRNLDLEFLFFFLFFFYSTEQGIAPSLLRRSSGTFLRGCDRSHLGDDASR